MNRKAVAIAVSGLAFLTLVGCGTNSSSTNHTQKKTTASNVTTGANSINTVSVNTTLTITTSSTNVSSTALANASSTSSQSTNTTSNSATTNLQANIPTSPVGYAAYSKQSLGSMISVTYSIQGTVTQMNETSSVLQSLTVKVTKPLQSVNGATSFKAGKVLKIYFQQPLSRAGTLQLAKGSNIELTFGQFARRSDNKLIYGSNFSWLTVEKNGVYYDAQGKVVKPITPSGKRG
ncbi:hypothetical protein [Alicyclobacillus mengziensis]|uniref:Lipoprotein n=1 Tax=Alicyclobacillus mengziensis TaxID=2931921 RepID=A0A9X7W2R8_9BACL|nr:hypothetical protein [Alicyclobacillus mengziensis]QSO49230.1 hypothetical protein JZ786_10080 [Alicyclobacillus mengziensis]